jgi:hypothetical protein
MTQQQRSKAFAIADSLEYTEAFIRINAQGDVLAPSNAPALERDWADSLVFQWDAYSYDDEGRQGTYRLRAGAR